MMRKKSTLVSSCYKNILETIENCYAKLKHMSVWHMFYAYSILFTFAIALHYINTVRKNFL